MYLSHFGLTEAPFGLTPDTAFAFATRAHQEALNTLLLAVDGGEGFIKIVGEIGTGKTLLCRRFLIKLAQAGDGYVTCYLPNPSLSPTTLLLALADELGLQMPANASQFKLLKAINQTLVDLAAQNKRVVVCLVEALALPLESLETLRLLSNLETEKRKLLQVVLLGQPELDDRLAQSNLRQLRQRISFHYRLSGLTREELRLYLDHRLRVAGYHGAEVFSPNSITKLQRASGGTPRLVNVLAHKALLMVFGEGGVKVEAAHIKAAARDTDGCMALAPRGLGWLWS